MEIVKWNKKGEKGQMVRINRKEALTLIQSLTEQLLEQNPNSGRAEFNTNEGEYFSIAVQDKPERPRVFNGFRISSLVKDKVTKKNLFLVDWSYASPAEIDGVYLQKRAWDKKDIVYRRFDQIEDATTYIFGPEKK